MKHIGTKNLETERLILRKFEMSDTEALYKNWASDPNVTKYLTWPTHTCIEESECVMKMWVESYQKDDFYHWAIVIKEISSEPIGCISVNESDTKTEKVTMGYCIGSNWWHKGIMSEALGRVIDFLFDEVGVNRIEAMHDPKNPYSGAVMRKCGMKHEGTLRSADCNNQGICDACYYGVLRSER